MPEAEQWLAAGPGAIDAGGAPAWVAPVLDRIAGLDPAAISRTDPPAAGLEARQAAVLVLLGNDSATGPFVVLQVRSAELRDHPGQIAFPGGMREPDDASPVATAIREATEEVGLDPAGVRPLALLPRLLIPVSNFAVSAVLAAWDAPAELVVDGTETTDVVLVPLPELGADAPWYELNHPAGWSGYALDHEIGTIWGYTADMLRAVTGGPY